MVMESPYEPVEPTLFFVKALNGGVSWMNIRIKPGAAIHQALPKIEAAFKKVVPNAPFDYKFVDEDYALKFAAEERISKLSGFFAAFAVKIPIFPLHTWQPGVYEQSNYPSVMVLSGIMVKMGVFGMLRWLAPIPPNSEIFRTPVFFSMISTTIHKARILMP